MMEVKAGDWVRFRGTTRVHEVYQVNIVVRDRSQDWLETTSGVKKPVAQVDEHAAKFWIRKVGS